MIWCVEDDASIRDIELYALRSAGLEAEGFTDGAAFWQALQSEKPDLVVLDVMLPGIDGTELLGRMRASTSLRRIPVIMATAKGAEYDRVRALDGGADDYLTKPFSVDELLARLRVTVRRLSLMQTDMTQNTSVFENGDLKIDYAAGCAYLNGEELHLTPIEYKLLILLSRNVGRVLTYTYITKNIWGSSWENDLASLRVFMATLRKKIEKDVNSPQYIQTHIGIGYRMLRV